MKAKLVYTSLTLIMLTLSAFFGMTVSAEVTVVPRTDAQEVHALLILLGNDRKIRESVEKNEEKMVNMLKQLSRHCDVHLTLMHSQSAHEGILSQKTFVNGRSENATTNAQDIIQAQQVEQWLENLKPNPEDTVLIYYNGHGKIGAFDTHSLLFDPGLNTDTLDREKLSQKLNRKRARLRMLITDTCSNLSEDLSDDTFAKFATVVRAKSRPYIQDLFLQHKGFLDITAASPGQFAIGNSDLGGHFTSALLSQGFTAAADADGDRDDFLSWTEAFAKAVEQTKILYDEATFDDGLQMDLGANNQKTQEPYQHSLPVRIGSGSIAPPTPPDTTETTTTFTGQDGAEMVLIPAGEFQMGSNDGEDDEKPVHTVYVDAFYMDKYEVTNAHYKRFVDANPQWQKDRIPGHFHDGDYLKNWNGDNYPQGKADHPVIWVSWYAAMAYAQWADKRLPTEAEWEYAARGGLVGQKYPRGNTITLKDANFGRNVNNTTGVGKYPANGYGLHDMAGNVWEWCLDEYDDSFYSESVARNPLSGADSVEWIMNKFTNVKYTRVLRGGSWTKSARSMRVAFRYGGAPADAGISDGFRCVRPVSP